jgi:hypothetical protein
MTDDGDFDESYPAVTALTDVIVHAKVGFSS